MLNLPKNPPHNLSSMHANAGPKNITPSLFGGNDEIFIYLFIIKSHTQYTTDRMDRAA